MRISHIRIKNILGIADLEFTPGAGFTEITGPNGSGKSSVLEAIKSVARGGHDATLLRDGEEKGEIVLVLDDGTEIQKHVTADKSDVAVKSPTGKARQRPGEFVKAIIDQLSSNPLELLKADKESRKNRLTVLLQALPITVDYERLTKIAGFQVLPAAAGIHPLYVIENTRKTVFDGRTGTNRAIKEKEATISQLTATMPDVSEGVDASEADLEALLGVIDGERDTELGRISNKLEGIRKSSHEQIDRIKSESKSKIDELRRQIAVIEQEEREAVESAKQELARIESLAAAQRQKTIEQHAADREPISAQLAAVKATRTAAAKRAQAIDTINQLTEQLDALKREADDQGQAIVDIDAYKRELLSALPIPGLEVRGDEIYRDGVHFDRLNTQQRVAIAVEIAKLKAGKLGAICVDGLELMDSEHYNEFREQMLASGLQAFVTYTSDSDFQIRSLP